MSLVTRLLTGPKPPHTLIAPNPRLEHIRSVRSFFLLFIFIFLGISLFTTLISFFLDSIHEISWPFLPPLSLFLLEFLYFSLLVYYWKRIEIRRFNAALKNPSLLADEQPQPDTGALQLPVKITVSMVAERRLFLGYVWFLGWVVAAYLYFITTAAPLAIPWYWALLAAVMIGCIIPLFFMLLLRKHNFLEVTEEGIRFRTSGGFVVMFWHEMSLFACYPEPGPWRNSPAVIYELSSASYVFCWTWMQRKGSFSRMGKAFVPFGEHTAQMRALCSLIVAKTGLPLYDLSKGQTLHIEESTRSEGSERNRLV